MNRNTILIIILGVLIGAAGLFGILAYRSSERNNGEVAGTITESPTATLTDSPTTTVTTTANSTVSPTSRSTTTATPRPTVRPTVTVRPTLTPTPIPTATLAPTTTPNPTRAVTATPTQTVTPTVAQTASCDSGAFLAQFLCLINDYRMDNGQTVLSLDSRLNQAALKHSTWMSDNNTLSHTGDNGSSFSQRCAAEGTTCSAETIAKSISTAQQLFNLWRNSSIHNAIMLGPYSALGLDISNGYVTALFR